MRFTFVSASSECAEETEGDEKNCHDAQKRRTKSCKSEKGKHIMWQSAESTELGKGKKGDRAGEGGTT
jgi:hypothetical protein